MKTKHSNVHPRSLTLPLALPTASHTHLTQRARHCRPCQSTCPRAPPPSAASRAAPRHTAQCQPCAPEEVSSIIITIGPILPAPLLSPTSPPCSPPHLDRLHGIDAVHVEHGLGPRVEQPQYHLRKLQVGAQPRRPAQVPSPGAPLRWAGTLFCHNRMHHQPSPIPHLPSLFGPQGPPAGRGGRRPCRRSA